MHTVIPAIQIFNKTTHEVTTNYLASTTNIIRIYTYISNKLYITIIILYIRQNPSSFNLQLVTIEFSTHFTNYKNINKLSGVKYY